MNISLLIRVIITGFAFISITACNIGEEKTEVSEFEYYPETNVYYDKSNNIFIYSLDSGKTWNNYVASSGQEPGTMGKKVVIQTAEPEVWRENQQHRTLYGGSILNVSRRKMLPDTALTGVKEKKSKTTRSVKPKKIEEDEKKEKKGIKGFFENIFKKKKES